MRKILFMMTLPYFIVCTVLAGYFISRLGKEGWPLHMDAKYLLLWSAIFAAVFSLGLIALISKSRSVALVKLCLIFAFLGVAQNLFCNDGHDYFADYTEGIYYLTALIALIPSAILAFQAICRLKAREQTEPTVRY